MWYQRRQAAGIVVTAVGQELVIAHPLAHSRSA
jgi:hypothetical protein